MPILFTVRKLKAVYKNNKSCSAINNLKSLKTQQLKACYTIKYITYITGDIRIVFSISNCVDGEMKD